MRKHTSALISAGLGSVLTVGSLVALSYTAPQHNIATLQLAGYDGPNITLKTDVQLENQRAVHFATPHIGQKFHGVPHHPSTIYATDYTWQGHSNWWCINYTKHSGDGIHNNTVHSLPNYTTSNGKSALKIMNAPDGLVSKITGASTVSKIHGIKAMTIWYLSKDRNFHADWAKYLVPQMKAKGDMGGFNSLLAWGRDHGSYTVTVKAPKVSVGQKGHGTVTVKAANGYAASDLQVSLSGNDNVKVSPRGGMTNGKGQLKFAYKVTDYGRVKVDADITAASSKEGLLTDASPGRQRLLTGHYTEHAHGSAAFRTRAGTVEMTTQCPTDCKGVSNVTFVGKVPSGSKPMRFWFYDDKGVVSRCDGTATKDCAKTVQLPDGDHWKGYDTCTLDKVGGSCVSSKIHVKRNTEIICPPVPVADVKQVNEIHCPCDGSPTLTGSLEATVTSLAGSSRFFETTLTDATTGSSKTVDLTNGTPNTFDVPFYNGDEYILTYKVFDRQGGNLLKQGQLMDATFNTTLN